MIVNIVKKYITVKRGYIKMKLNTNIYTPKEKEREWGSFILMWIGASASFYFSESIPPYSYLLYLFGMLCCYECIKSIVTYDITKWKNAKFWIWFGGIFGILGSFIVYWYLRSKNKVYIVKNNEVDNLKE